MVESTPVSIQYDAFFVFVRHAERLDDNSAVTDQERQLKGFKDEYELDTPLSNRGIKQAQTTGKHIAARLLASAS